jgi:hypothetical protein
MRNHNYLSRKITDNIYIIFMLLIGVILLNPTQGSATVNKKLSSTNGKKIELVFDKYLSEYTGSSVIQSGFAIYSYMMPYTHNKQGFLPVVQRTGRLLFDNYLNFFFITVNHEFFGHGARFREIGWDITRYEFNWNLSGSTGFRRPKNNALRSEINNGTFFLRENVSNLAGIESSDVMANDIASKVVIEKNISVSRAILFSAAALDQILYIAMTINTKNDIFDRGGDISEYYKQINAMYATNKRGAFGTNRYFDYVFKDSWDFRINNPTVLTKEDIKMGVYISLLDPFLWFSAYTQLRYIFVGKDNLPIPMFKIKSLYYLPRVRTVLAPFGLLTQIQNYFKYNDKNFIVTFEGGKTANQAYYTLGAETYLFKINSTLRWGAKIFAWHQPELYTLNMRDAESKFGMLGLLKAKINFSHKFGVLAYAGYKSRGYVQGEKLDSGLIFRAGLSYVL